MMANKGKFMAGAGGAAVPAMGEPRLILVFTLVGLWALRRARP